MKQIESLSLNREQLCNTYPDIMPQCKCVCVCRYKYLYIHIYIILKFYDILDFLYIFIKTFCGLKKYCRYRPIGTLTNTFHFPDMLLCPPMPLFWAMVTIKQKRILLKKKKLCSRKDKAYKSRLSLILWEGASQEIITPWKQWINQ